MYPNILPTPFDYEPKNEKEPFDWKALAKALGVFALVAAPIGVIVYCMATGRKQALEVIGNIFGYAVLWACCCAIIAVLYWTFYSTNDGAQRGAKHANDPEVEQANDLEKAADLEAEFERFLDDVEGAPRMYHSDEQIEWGKDIARHFAEWGAEHLKR